MHVACNTYICVRVCIKSDTIDENYKEEQI